jgi:hypothetical protein
MPAHTGMARTLDPGLRPEGEHSGLAANHRALSTPES